MATPTHIGSLKEDDLQIKDAPVTGGSLRDAFRRLFASLNPYFDGIDKIAAKGGTFTENMRCEVVSGAFTHGTAQQVRLATLTRAGSALVLGADGQLPMMATVVMVQGTTQPKPLATVTIYFNDATAAKVNCVVLLLPEGQQTSTTPTFLDWVGDRSWTAMAGSLTNSWTDSGAPELACAYKKEGNRRVYLRGSMKSGTITAAAFTLPAGYRPSARVRVACDSNGAFGECLITSAGVITPNVGSNAHFSLDGISFDTL